MGETHLLQFQDRKIRLLEDETQALQASDQSRNGDFLAVVEQLVADCLRLPEDIERAWKRIRQVITSGAEIDYQATGDTLKETFARLISLLTAVHSLTAGVARTTGREVERQDELIDALAALRNMETRILSAWPWPEAPFSPVDMAMVEASRRAHAAGESEDLEDILARLKIGGDLTQEA